MQWQCCWDFFFHPPPPSSRPPQARGVLAGRVTSLLLAIGDLLRRVYQVSKVLFPSPTLTTREVRPWPWHVSDRQGGREDTAILPFYICYTIRFWWWQKTVLACLWVLMIRRPSYLYNFDFVSTYCNSPTCFNSILCPLQLWFNLLLVIGGSNLYILMYMICIGVYLINEDHT